MTSEDSADNFGQSSFQICILCSGCVNFRFDMKKAAVTVTKRLFIILFQIAIVYHFVSNCVALSMFGIKKK